MTAAYLDYNATTPARPEAVAAAMAWLGETGNPSSVHRAGRQARQRIDAARAAIATLVDAPPAWVVFTATGTEANDLALAGVSVAARAISAIEHESVRAAAADAVVMPVDGEGRLDLDAAERLLTALSQPALISVMLANNETGVLQPITDLVRIARKRDAIVHCDASQAPGRVALSMTALGVDLMTLSAHKMGGIPGAAALVVADRVALRPRLRGGGQESGRRAGTENGPAICAFAVAAELALRDLADAPRVAARRDRLEAALLALDPAARVAGRAAARLPNTSCVTMPGVAAETQVMAFDLAGVQVSAGSACSSGKVKRSAVLDTMGFGADAATAVRVSHGWATDDTDIDRFVAVWADLRRRTTARLAEAA